MPVTIHDLCALPDLDLTQIAGRDNDRSEIRWVHVSEVEDPTPWLRGGELLLTTGLRLTTAEAQIAFVHRVADADLAGIGFGVGVDHVEVPTEMIRAADDRGIALIRVPVGTPYVAISEAVSNMLAADRYDAIVRAFEAQQRLTRAALGSAREIIHELSRQLSGWAAFTDPSGEIIQAWPPEAADRVPELRPDLVRARESGRASTSIVSSESSSVIYALSVDGLARGFLLAGVDTKIDVYERSVLSTASTLLTLELERTHATTIRLHRLRSSALQHALRDREPSREFLRHVVSWGLDPEAVQLYTYLCDAEAADALFDRVLAVLVTAAGAAALVPDGDEKQVVVLLSDDADTEAELVALAGDASVPLGIGTTTSAADIRRNYRGALHAAQIGKNGGRPATRFSDLATMQLLLGASSTGSLDDYLDAVLGPLSAERVSTKNAVLKHTLEVFLSCNGKWSDAATQLGIHRHTLRARIERIIELTGRDPESAYSRMELWLALLIEGTLVPR